MTAAERDECIELIERLISNGNNWMDGGEAPFTDLQGDLSKKLFNVFSIKPIITFDRGTVLYFEFKRGDSSTIWVSVDMFGKVGITRSYTDGKIKDAEVNTYIADWAETVEKEIQEFLNI